jgi:hypothetical protein
VKNPGTASAPLLRLLFLFFFLVNRNRLQVFCLEDVATLQASDVIYSVAPVQKFGSLVLTNLHSEISPILD